MAERDDRPADTLRYQRALREASLRTRTSMDAICDTTLAAHLVLKSRGAQLTAIELINYVLGRIPSTALRDSTDWSSVMREFVAGYHVAPAAPSSPEPPSVHSAWEYSAYDDEMSSGKIYYAKLTSVNTVNFGFPYEGAQHATLTLRTHPRYGKDVILSLERGQFRCSSYDGCNVLVRFDNSEPTSYTAQGPEDNSTEHLFIAPYSQFVARLGRAQRVRVSATVYQEGAQVFEFDVAGFSPKDYRPSSK